jgi:hypothetical protein
MVSLKKLILIKGLFFHLKLLIIHDIWPLIVSVIGTNEGDYLATNCLNFPTAEFSRLLQQFDLNRCYHPHS